MYVPGYAYANRVVCFVARDSRSVFVLLSHVGILCSHFDRAVTGLPAADGEAGR